MSVCSNCRENTYSWEITHILFFSVIFRHVHPPMQHNILLGTYFTSFNYNLSSYFALIITNSHETHCVVLASPYRGSHLTMSISSQWTDVQGPYSQCCHLFEKYCTKHLISDLLTHPEGKGQGQGHSNPQHVVWESFIR